MTVDLRPPRLDGVRVLVVENEFYIAMEIKREIERAGGTVIGPHATLDNGLAGLAGASPDCALLDINLGDGPTFVLADALHAQNIPFVFLTGYDAEIIPSRFARVTRVEKPVRRQGVAAAIARLCTA